MSIDDVTYEEARAWLRRRGIAFPICGGDGTDDDNDNGNGDEGNNRDDGGNNDRSDKPKSYSESQVESIVKKRLARERERIAGEVKADLEAQAKLAKAKADGDLQKVIDQQAKELEKFDILKPVLQEYEALAEERFKAQFDTLPDALKMLAPDDDATPLAKERWLTRKALPALEKLKGTEGGDSTKKGDATKQDQKKTTTKRGNNPPEFENISETSKQRIDDMVEQYRSGPAYRTMVM